MHAFTRYSKDYFKTYILTFKSKFRRIFQYMIISLFLFLKFKVPKYIFLILWQSIVFSRPTEWPLNGIFYLWHPVLRSLWIFWVNTQKIVMRRHCAVIFATAANMQYRTRESWGLPVLIFHNFNQDGRQSVSIEPAFPLKITNATHHITKYSATY